MNKGIATIMAAAPAGKSPTLDTFEQQRDAVRDSLFLQAALRDLETGHTLTGRVRNLAPGGMMIDSAAIPAIGSAHEIELRGIGPIRGRIAWADKGRIGVSFDSPIDPKAARKPVSAAR